MKTEVAMFGMGCFWKPQFLFDKIPGVIKTRVGYSGGGEEKDTYSYGEVRSGFTNHAEVIKIWFDPEKINYKKLLNFFWNSHNPTTLNRQGPDIGTQYRSAIFYLNEGQKIIAEKSIMEQQEKFINNKIVTEIKKSGKFYEAEGHHQKYLEKLG